METQKLDGLATANLLGASYAEPDRTDEDFLQQNELINQELKKHDKRLNTCSMCVFRFWIILYMTMISCEVILQTVNLYKLSNLRSTFDLMVCIFVGLNILVPFPLLYGCVLFWSALHSKDIFKIERCIFIFKAWLFIGFVFFGIDVALNLFDQYSTWDQIFAGRLVKLVFAAINLGTGLYVKRVLKERDLFQQVSSYQ